MAGKLTIIPLVQAHILNLWPSMPDLSGGHRDVVIDVDGQPQRVFGDPNMDYRTREVLAALVKAVQRAVADRRPLNRDDGNYQQNEAIMIVSNERRCYVASNGFQLNGDDGAPFVGNPRDCRKLAEKYLANLGSGASLDVIDFDSGEVVDVVEERIEYDNWHYAEIGKDKLGWHVNAFSVEPSDGSAEWKGSDDRLESRQAAIMAGGGHCFGDDPTDWPRGWLD